MVRRKSYEEQIEALNGQITRVEEKLNNLLEQKEELERKKHLEELENISIFLKNNNLTLQDIEDIINSQKLLQSA